MGMLSAQTRRPAWLKERRSGARQSSAVTAKTGSCPGRRDPVVEPVLAGVDARSKGSPGRPGHGRHRAAQRAAGALRHQPFQSRQVARPAHGLIRPKVALSSPMTSTRLRLSSRATVAPVRRQVCCGPGCRGRKRGPVQAAARSCPAPFPERLPLRDPARSAAASQAGGRADPAARSSALGVADAVGLGGDRHALRQQHHNGEKQPEHQISVGAYETANSPANARARAGRKRLAQRSLRSPPATPTRILAQLMLAYKLDRDQQQDEAERDRQYLLFDRYSHKGLLRDRAAALVRPPRRGNIGVPAQGGGSSGDSSALG